MPERYTYNEVKEFIEKDSGGKCKLLSTEYINTKTPLLLQCKCGNTFTRTFEKIKARHGYACKECRYKKMHHENSYSYDYIKQKISEKGCELLSKNYYNSSQKLLIRCKCGNTFKRTFRKFNSGQINCQECANRKTAEAKIKYTKDVIIEKLAERNYILISDYIDWKHKITCQCERGHVFTMWVHQYMTGHAGCKQCANENLRGANHYNYKGGESEVIDFLRKNIKQWKSEVLKKYDYKCYITGKHKADLVIHHIKSFNTIIQEVFNELQLEIKRKLKDYTQDEIEKIRESIDKKHDVNNGVVICRHIHNKFHEIYGKGDNTLEQFNEFLSKHYPNTKPLGGF